MSARRRRFPQRQSAEAFLCWVGSAAERSSLERRVTRLAFVLATCCVMVACAVLGVAHATYSGRIERDYARTATGDFAGVADHGEGAIRVVFDNVGDQWVVVILADPVPGSPVMPGLDRWPDPGGVALSPVLAGTDAGRELVARYGDHEVGTVGVEGLASPEEPVVVAVPPRGVLTPGANYALDEFGGLTDPGPWGDGLAGGALYQRPLAAVLAGLGVGFLLPSLVLLSVTCRAGAVKRDRRSAVIAALGAGPNQIRAMHLGEFLPSLLWGAGIASALVSLLFLCDLRIPYVGFTVLAHDVRAGWISIVGLMMAACAVCLLLPLFLNRPRRLVGARPRPKAARFKLSGLVWLPAASFCMTHIFHWSLALEDSWVRIFILYVGIAVIALAIPGFLRAGTQLVSRILVYVAHAVRSPGVLIGARANLGEPGAATRLGTGIAVTIILVAHVMVLSTLTTPGARSAAQVQERIGTSLLELQVPQESSQAVAALVETLAQHDAGVIALRNIDSVAQPTRYELTATCHTLRDAGLRCVEESVSVDARLDERLGVAAQLAGASTLDVNVAADDRAVIMMASEDQPMMKFALSRHGAQLPTGQITSQLTHRSIPSAALSPPLQDWVIGLHDSRVKARWNVLVVALATAIFTVALTVAGLADSRVLAAQAGVTAIWSPSWYTLFSIAATRTFPSLLMAIATGNVVAWWTATPFTLPPLEGFFPPAYLIATLMVPTAVTLLVVAGSTVLQHQALRRWRPGRSAT